MLCNNNGGKTWQNLTVHEQNLFEESRSAFLILVIKIDCRIKQLLDAGKKIDQYKSGQPKSGCWICYLKYNKSE